MTITTATVPVFGDTAIIATIIQDMRIEYDEDGHIIGSQEYFDAERYRLEAEFDALEEDIEGAETDISHIKRRHERELESLEQQLDDLRRSQNTVDRRIGETWRKADNAPTEAELLDIWPNPPYGASLLVSLFDEPEPVPYGTSLLESAL